MKKEFKFSNGDSVVETISGFTGIITGIDFYITGCNQYLVTAKSENEISESKALWYDEGRLTLLEKQTTTESEVEADDNGSDIEAPIK